MTPSDTTRDGYLDVNGTADRLGVSVRTLWRMVPGLERDGVAMRVPPRTGRYRVHQPKLDAWLAAGGQTSPSRGRSPGPAVR